MHTRAGSGPDRSARELTSRLGSAPQQGVSQADAVLALQRSHGNRVTARWVLARQKGAAAAEPRRPWIEHATSASERRARAMDEHEKLREPDLRRRREELAAKAAGTSSAEQKAALESLEDIEAVAQARGIEPRAEHYSKYATGRTQKRMNLRARLEEGVRRLRSFRKALAEVRSVDRTRETGDDLDLLQAETDAFRQEFRRRARLSAMDMLDGSVVAIRAIVESYGLRWDMTRTAAEDVRLRGGKLATEVSEVVHMTSQRELVDAPKSKWVDKRVELGVSARGLQQLQQSLAEKAAASQAYYKLWEKDKASFERSHGAAARAADKTLTAARDELKAAWAQAERLQPVLTSLRRDKAGIETVALHKLASQSVEDKMTAVLTELVPKLNDVKRAAIKIRDKEVDPLTLPQVVALTRATMFIPKGSLRDGDINDAVSDAKDKADSTLLQIAAFALAAITFIPTAGASLTIPAGLAAVGFAAHSATREWEKYTNQQILTNTHLDLARSLATEEPSLTGFALSLVGTGLEAVPLLAAFNKARKLKNAIFTAGGRSSDEALRLVDELNKLGKTNDGTPLGTRALNDIQGGPGAKPTSVKETAKDEAQKVSSKAPGKSGKDKHSAEPADPRKGAQKPPPEDFIRRLDEFRAPRPGEKEAEWVRRTTDYGTAEDAIRRMYLSNALADMHRARVRAAVYDPDARWQHYLTAGGYEDVLRTSSLRSGTGVANLGGGDSVRAHLVSELASAPKQTYFDFSVPNPPVKPHAVSYMAGDYAAWSLPAGTLMKVRIHRIRYANGAVAQRLEDIGGRPMYLLRYGGHQRVVGVPELLEKGERPTLP